MSTILYGLADLRKHLDILTIYVISDKIICSKDKLSTKKGYGH